MMRMALSWLGVLLLVPHVVAAQSTCDVQGVWQLVSGTADGEPVPEDWKQMKLITETHFAFVGENNSRSEEDLATPADSLRAFRTMSSGGGTYTVTGSSYTETIEYFRDPGYVGRSLTFECRTEGDRFYQSGDLPIIEGGVEVGRVRLEEEWRRIG